VLKNEKLMKLTVTGAATYQFCAAYATIADDGQIVARPQPADSIAQLSSIVFESLLADVRARRPGFELGRGQDDARMTVEMFVDMLELTPDGEDSRGWAAENAVTQLFRHKYDLTINCRECGRVHKPPPEGKMAVFNLISQRRRPFPEDAQEFSSFIRRVALWNDDYKCEGCNVRSKTITTYNLEIVPEILLCMFNLKTDQWRHVHRVNGRPVPGSASGARIARYFPAHLEFPALGGGTIVFRLVGQAEHSGGNSSGHYWARGLRAGGSVHRLNDTGTSPDRFGPSPETYLIAYHYDSFIPNR
jgi:hypothetical protein